MIKKYQRVLLSLLIISAVFILSATLLRGLFPKKHYDTVEKYCTEFETDINLVLALIKAESNFRTDAVSHAGAKGIMQITDETFEFCNRNLKTSDADIFNPEDNIRAGVWYLSYLLKRYNHSITKAVSAYNAGASNIDSWLKDPRYSDDGESLSHIPFKETRSHVDKIKRYTSIYRFLY